MRKTFATLAALGGMLMTCGSAHAMPWSFTIGGSTDTINGADAVEAYTLNLVVDPDLYMPDVSFPPINVGPATVTTTLGGITSTYLLDFHFGESVLSNELSATGIGQDRAAQSLFGLTAFGQLVFAGGDVSSMVNAFLASPDFGQTLTYALQSGDTGFTLFSVSDENGDPFLDFFDNDPEFFSIAPANDLPEPASSGLIALGLAALAIRRRKLAGRQAD